MNTQKKAQREGVAGLTASEVLARGQLALLWKAGGVASWQQEREAEEGCSRHGGREAETGSRRVLRQGTPQGSAPSNWVSHSFPWGDVSKYLFPKAGHRLKKRFHPGPTW